MSTHTDQAPGYAGDTAEHRDAVSEAPPRKSRAYKSFMQILGGFGIHVLSVIAFLALTFAAGLHWLAAAILVTIIVIPVGFFLHRRKAYFRAIGIQFVIVVVAGLLFSLVT